MRNGWEYRGRGALVTGASAGIGEAFARELARLLMTELRAALEPGCVRSPTGIEPR